jgi:DNA-binding MarR family transcriptional regulator
MKSEGVNEDSGIVLGILQAIDSEDKITQRAVANELGIALGLVNTYLRRFVRKGLVKVQAAPARRYAYYLTPKGFAEKSKLTAQYFSHSFAFFRTAKEDCRAILSQASERRMKRLAMVGISDLTEIMLLYAPSFDVQVTAVHHYGYAATTYLGVPVVTALDQLSGEKASDGLVITDLVSPEAATKKAIAAVGVEKVLIPKLIEVRARTRARRSNSK